MNPTGSPPERAKRGRPRKIPLPADESVVPADESAVREFMKRGLAATQAVDAFIEAAPTRLDDAQWRHSLSAAAREQLKAINEVETFDAMRVVQNLGLTVNYERIKIVRDALEKHWLAGWRAAGGPEGARKR